MVKLTTLLLIAVVSIGLVAGPAHANEDPLARLEGAADARATASPDGSYGSPPIGPLAFLILYNQLYYCWEMFARQTGGDSFTLRGQTKFYNGNPFLQAAIGLALISGSDLIWGIESFPNPLLPFALKVGGTLALATLQGAAKGYVLTPQGVAGIGLGQVVALALLLGGPCPPVFPEAVADKK